MTPDTKKCLHALNELTIPNGEMCTPFLPIMERTEFDRKTVRRNVRRLWRAGLAEYFRGLCTEDGAMAGAGYCITKAGQAFAEKDNPSKVLWKDSNYYVGGDS